MYTSKGSISVRSFDPDTLAEDEDEDELEQANEEEVPVRTEPESEEEQDVQQPLKTKISPSQGT